VAQGRRDIVTYVVWHEKPEHTRNATVSKPDDLKALANQAQWLAEAQEIEYPPDERMTNIRIAGARRDRFWRIT
jgi:hypothetical protein